MRLQHLIVHSDRSVRLAAIAAVGNLALNTANQRVMQVQDRIIVGKGVIICYYNRKYDTIYAHSYCSTWSHCCFPTLNAWMKWVEKVEVMDLVKMIYNNFFNRYSHLQISPPYLNGTYNLFLLYQGSVSRMVLFLINGNIPFFSSNLL